jgi:uncharacterized protein
MSERIDFVAEDIRFGQKDSPRQPKFNGYTTQSIYIAVRDRTKLAADIYLPKDMPAGEKVPTLLYRTRYWRAAELREPNYEPNPTIQFFTSYGYAVIHMDVRGTGASFGAMLHDWQPIDTQDTYDVCDWIVLQPWSNGKVGAYGVSYPGTTAELLAETNHPSVTAIWATYFELDGYGDIACPGGVPSIFVKTWGEYTRALDHNILPDDDLANPRVIGVKPVDEDQDHTLLKEAVKQHEKNNNADVVISRQVYRDDDPGLGFDPEQMMVFPRRRKIEQSNAPLDIWGSWMDANTPDTVIRHFTTFKNPVRGVIGAWSHGGGSFHSQFMPPGTGLDIPRAAQLHEIMRHFDQYFHGIDWGLAERILFYYTMGEEKWKSSTTFPIPKTDMTRWYFRTGNQLNQKRPFETSGFEQYQVNFEATTGSQNRWWTEMGGGPVVYPDRAEADKKLLVYESDRLNADMEVTGYPVVTLYITSTATDGAFFVYLEDVDEDGAVTYITEGMLRALHRKISNDQPPYRVFAPYHTFKRKDGALLVPGEITKLSFGLIPTSVLFRKGHRIRVAIAGADASTFVRVPLEGNPLIKIEHTGLNASCIDLPVIPR